MSDSARHILYSIPEVTYGVTPTSPAFLTVRHTGTTLALAKGSLKSAEIRSDRQVHDFRQGTLLVGGNITGELSYGTYDSYLESVFQSAFAAKAAPYTAATISAAASDNSINDSANGLPVLDPGDKVTIAGFTGGSTTANQSDLVVVSSTVSKMILSGGVAFVNDASGESVTVTTLTNRLKVGSTRKSFSILRNYADLSDGSPNKPWHLFTGVEMNTLTLTIAAGDKLAMIEFATIGQNKTNNPTAPSGATFGAGSTPNANPPMDTFTGSLKEGGTTIGTVTEITMKVEEGLAAKDTIGTAQTSLPSDGQCNVTGQVTVYFQDSSLSDKFLSGASSSLDITLKDGLLNAIRFYAPKIIYTGEASDVKGQGPITLVLPFQALYDATTGTTLLVDRNPT